MTENWNIILGDALFFTEENIQATVGCELLEMGLDEEFANASAEVAGHMELKGAAVEDSNPRGEVEVAAALQLNILW